jgi:DNA-binding HxlR family transcriptional regulator/putative sterol carrier protein
VPKRSYGQYEGLARTLDVVGERWTLLLLRELLLGPRRYKDLLEGLPGIGTNLLAKRLKHLESEDVILRKMLPPPAASAVYELTARGRQLERALHALARWGVDSMEAPADMDVLRPGWGVLAMQSTFRPERAGGVRETYEFRIGDDVFHLSVNDGSLKAEQGPAAKPDLVISTDVETLMAIGARQLSPADAAASGRAEVVGDPDASRRCVEIFGLPEPEPAELAGAERPPGWGPLAMRATFHADSAQGVSETYEMRIDDEIFHMIIDNGALTTAEGAAQDPDLVFTTDLKTFLAIGAGQIGPIEAVAGGRAVISGDAAAAMRCLEIFGFNRPKVKSP